MIFSPDLCELILAGKKTVTRRPVKFRAVEMDTSEGKRMVSYAQMWAALPCRYKPFRVYSVQPGRGKKGVARIRILGAERCPLSYITHSGEARREGFATVEEFTQKWASLYRHCDYEQLVWRIEFELVTS